ncbi:uncharacterized protein [Halyomorpha halys]|uniref:uncharacterized protein n=1 Tax=Halyomorpha halys TaxID=286706 RepID=UPI0034D19EA8
MDKGNQSVSALRQSLREKAFEEWANCRWQGIGVRNFKETPKANRYVCDKQVLSGSEWANALKLNINCAPMRGVQGASGQQGEVGSLCRICGRESETRAHVLGKCPNNSLLITARHHMVKEELMKFLERKDFACFEEVYCVDIDGSVRYADIVAFIKIGGTALVLDPTVRFGSNDFEQEGGVEREKNEIYEKCVPLLKEKFRETFGEREFTVRDHHQQTSGLDLAEQYQIKQGAS